MGLGILIINGNKVRRIGGGGSQMDGEKIPGDLAGWDVLTTDPNYILESTYGDLQKRSMTLYHTHPIARGAVNKQVDYSIGPGLVFRSQPDWQTIGKSKSWGKDWGKEFQKLLHYYFLEMGFYDKQPVMMRGALTTGDSGLDFVRDEKGHLFDLVEFGGDLIDWQAKKENYTLGIKHDSLLRREGIITAEGKEVPFRNTAGDQQVVLFLLKELPRQLRGYPLIYSVINLCKQDDRHMDATTKRAVMEAVVMASAKSDGTNFTKQFDNLDDIAQEDKRGGAFSRIMARIGSKQTPAGTVLNMGTGESWEFHDIKTPSSTFGDFKEWIVHYIGAATGTPPEVILSKYSTSYTAHRGALNDFEKSYMFKRRIFERNVMYPVIREIAKELILQRFIDAPGFFNGGPIIQRAYLQGMTLGPVPGFINPMQEVNADIKAVDAAFKLRSDVAARYGNEWDNFFEEWAEEQKQFSNASPEKRAELIQKQEEQSGGQSQPAQTSDKEEGGKDDENN